MSLLTEFEYKVTGLRHAHKHAADLSFLHKQAFIQVTDPNAFNEDPDHFTISGPGIPRPFYPDRILAFYNDGKMPSRWFTNSVYHDGAILRTYFDRSEIGELIRSMKIKMNTYPEIELIISGSGLSLDSQLVFYRDYELTGAILCKPLLQFFNPKK